MERSVRDLWKSSLTDNLQAVTKEITTMQE